MTSPIQVNDIKLAAKSSLKRGFKAEAERKAKQYREVLNLPPYSPLCAFELANYINVPVYKATDILVDSNVIEHLIGTEDNRSEWSALTMITEAGNQIIIYNPNNSKARQQSDLMHELAHIICKHERQHLEYDFDIPIGMRHFNDVHEAEATTLGATLQLASPCLIWAKNKGMSYDEVSEYFNASIEMVRFRMNTSGVGKRM